DCRDRLFAGLCPGSDPAQHRPPNKGPAGGCLRPALRGRHVRPRLGAARAPLRSRSRQGSSRDAPRRSAGVGAAAVWDPLGGMPGMRMMVDPVAALSEAGRQLRAHYCFQPMMQPGEMKRTFVEQGLVNITEMQLMIRMDYLSFDDYWTPIAAGEGPLGK